MTGSVSRSKPLSLQTCTSPTDDTRMSVETVAVPL